MIFTPEQIKAGRDLYSKETGNHPTIHCNQFPTWAELMADRRIEYIERAMPIPTIDLMRISYNRIIDTYLETYPDLPKELMANDIVSHICGIIEKSKEKQ